MSNTIDNRTVQMDFENKRFESGVQDSLKSIDALKKGLNFDGATKGLENIDSSSKKLNFGPISEGVSALANRFSIMGIVGITAIQNITNRLINMAEQLARTFVIDPIKTGFEEYETKLDSIQTILANTQKEGTNLKIVTDALNELNTYADKTIYNFKEMTRNIGTFTAAGVKLDTSVAAIKGIANLAAVSGSNAQQASTAMYQLSQALSTGTLKLMDWNSVVNAGMGGQVFQDALKETARVHGIAVDQIIEEEGSFRDSLAKGWATSEILTETLAKFTGDLTESQLKTIGYNDEQIAGIIKMGQTANDAATKVKTLTQLNDTLKEAAQSGWAQTWELIAGDFDEAKAFFTELSDTFGGIIGANSDARNAIVQTWKDLGGRTALLDVVRNSIQGILSVVKPFTDALKEIFPPITGRQLAELTTALAIVSQKFKIGADTADKLRRIFKGVFAVFDIGRMFIVALVKQIQSLFGSYSSLIPQLTDGAASLGDWLVTLRDTIKESDTFTKVLAPITKAIKTVINVIGSLIVGISALFTSLKGGDTSKFKDFLGTLKEKLTSLGKLGVIIQKVLEIIVKIGEKLAPIIAKIREKLGEAINGLLDRLTNWLDKFDIDKFLDTLNKGFLGAVLLSLKGFIDSGKKLLGTGLFAGILISIKQFIDNAGGTFEGIKDVLDSVKGTLEAYQKQLQANTLLKIAGAIAILAISLIALSFIPSERLFNATAAMGALFSGLVIGFQQFDKLTADPRKMASTLIGLIGITTALLVLTGSILILSKLDPKELIQGLLALASIFSMIVLFLKFANTSKGLIRVSLGLIVFSGALLLFSLALKAFGRMKPQEIVVGLLAMAGAFTILIAALNLMPTDLLKQSISLVILSGALLLIAEAMTRMGSLSWDEVARGLATLGATLLLLGIALTAMSGSIGGSFALIVAAGALLILAGAMKVLGSLSLEQVGIALLAIAGVLIILGVAGSVLAPVVPILLLLAGAMLLIGVAALAFGIGVLAAAAAIGILAIAIATLAALGGTAIATVTLIIGGLATLIPLIAVQVAKGITAFLKQIAESASDISASVVGIALRIFEGFVSLIPTMVDGVLTFVTTLLQKLAEKLPEIVQAGYDILLALLEGFADNIEDIILVADEIIITLLRTWGEDLPAVVDAGYDAIVAFIDGLAAAAEENIPRLMSAVNRLGLAIIRGVLVGIANGRSEVLTGIREIGEAIIREFAASLGIKSPSDAFIEQAGFIIQGLVDGFKQFGKNVYSSVEDLGNETVSRFGSVISKLSSVINSEVDLDPTIRPVMDLTGVISGSKQLNGIVSGTGLNLTPTVNATKGINIGSPVEPQQTNPELSSDKSTGVQFIQNNYSPKELSRIDIYRQTKNQLLQAKGIVGGR